MGYEGSCRFINDFHLSLKNLSFFIIDFVLHIFSFKSPALRAEMNEEGDADCAFSMRNGVKQDKI